MARKTHEELAAELRKCPQKGSRWQHYRTHDVYTVTGVAIDEHSLYPLVIYTNLRAKIPISWARRLSVFRAPVMCDGRWVQRFTEV